MTNFEKFDSFLTGLAMKKTHFSHFLGLSLWNEVFILSCCILFGPS